MDAPLRGFSLTSFRSLVYPRPCEDLLPYLRFAWPLSLGNKVNQPVFRYDPPRTTRTHTHGCIYRNNTYTNPRNTDTYTLTLYTRPRSRVLLHWFRWCERGIGQTMNTKAHGLVYRDGGAKACSSRRGGPRNGRLLSSLVNNSFDIRGWKRTDDRTGWEGRERKLLKNWFLPFRIPFDQWAKHRCVASSLRVLAPNTCDWFKLKGRNPIEVVVEQTSEKKKRGKENRKKGE